MKKKTKKSPLYGVEMGVAQQDVINQYRIHLHSDIPLNSILTESKLAWTKKEVLPVAQFIPKLG